MAACSRDGSWRFQGEVLLNSIPCLTLRLSLEQSLRQLALFQPHPPREAAYGPRKHSARLTAASSPEPVVSPKSKLAGSLTMAWFTTSASVFGSDSFAS
ncbi:hypothetical protein AK812_SmicGene21915 [Symbiodinium microadriaticum]|uniref:Uncharacterized protein n=1 Tax=Symbiodinium microadriaticum TaxID=2951 RepID=A0A1Q9DL96_SYMMI|nr:hypothetical protein AK812_SmicGene21915 [Symbiodinium microadriaticum]